MTLKIITGLSVLIAVLSALSAFLTVRRVKRQIREILEILTEVRDGNGSRRILTPPDSPAAPLVYELNGIIRSYEDRLAAYRKTEEANQQLMTSLSHDVRTPLTTLIGYLDAVHRGIADGKEREADIETARQKAYDLKEYIDILFDWFRLHSDEFIMNPETVEAGELTRNILIDWISVLEDQQIEYIVDIPEQPVCADLDPGSYVRIVNNLIQNAVAHSQADRLVIKLTKQDREWNLCLSDNGIGMEREDLAHIFDRLYKCDKGRSGKGSGLGLSIARQLAEKMSGRIKAESAPGAGTAFTLYFPLAGQSSKLQG